MMDSRELASHIVSLVERSTNNYNALNEMKNRSTLPDDVRKILGENTTSAFNEMTKNQRRFINLVLRVVNTMDRDEILDIIFKHLPSDSAWKMVDGKITATMIETSDDDSDDE